MTLMIKFTWPNWLWRIEFWYKCTLRTSKPYLWYLFNVRLPFRHKFIYKLVPVPGTQQLRLVNRWSRKQIGKDILMFRFGDKK